MNRVPDGYPDLSIYDYFIMFLGDCAARNDRQWTANPTEFVTDQKQADGFPGAGICTY